jgi:hypothetical protein
VGSVAGYQSSAAYRLRPFNYLLSHWPGRTRLLRDYGEGTPSNVDALVASGDCFITLATVLDETSELLHTATIDKTVRPLLENVTRTLLYLQRHYTIVAKHPDHRQ